MTYFGRKTLRAILLTAAVLLASGISLTAYAAGMRNAGPKQELHIPSLEDELRYGYPKNEAGETYGLTYGDAMPEAPDLELAENADGVIGYVRASETPGAQVTTPEEAVAYMNGRTGDGCYVNLYLQDGATVIGQFWVDSGSVFPQ